MDRDNALFINEIKFLEIGFLRKLESSLLLFLDEHHSLLKSLEFYRPLQMLLQNFVNHNFEGILQMPLSDFKIQISGEHDTLENIIKDFLNLNHQDSTPLDHVKHLIALILGISALLEFVKFNWTGPRPLKPIKYNLISALFKDQDIYTKELNKFLSKDGEFISSNVLNSELLYFSYLVISSLSPMICPTQKWWLFRCIMMHQRILSDGNLSLHNEMHSLILELLNIDWLNEEKNLFLKAELLIESTHMHLFYHEITPAKEYLTEAKKLLGFQFELSGAEGKRTRYQQKATAQLFTKVESKFGVNVEYETLDKSFFPLDLHLDDDTLLNSIAFTDENSDIKNNSLHLLEQIVLLCYCTLRTKSTANDELLHEEIMAYVTCLLHQKKYWSVYIKALLIRCRLEKYNSRKVERAMMQMETIIEFIKNDKVPFSFRFPMYFSTSPPLYWMVEKEFADLLISLGYIKTALEIYERLNIWEDIITCYQRLGRMKCAEKLIREELVKQETPMLWCLLGDTTDDPNHYLKAWELSDHKNARAQRSLGYYYFKRKEYEKCLSCFLAALEINNLQPSVWFSLGYAATKCNDYELAAKSYRHVVTLDPDNYEAWNNLSDAYIKTKQKFRAWRSLQEALRCNYEEWRVWENFLIVSIDLGAFDEVIQAWHRLLDLKGKYNDPEILNILTNAIINGIPDNNGLTASRLQKKALQLLGRITSHMSTDPQIWESYACLTYKDFIESTNEKKKEIFEKVVIYQQKAIKFSLDSTKWETDFSLCKTLLDRTLKLAEYSIAYVKILDGENTTVPQKTSAKLLLKNVINRVEKRKENYALSELAELENLIEQIRQNINEIENL